MANQSKLAAPSQRSNTRASTTANTASRTTRTADDKENEPAHPSHRTVPAKRSIADDDDDGSEYEDRAGYEREDRNEGPPDDRASDDEDFEYPPAMSVGHTAHVSDDEEDEHPVRGGRTRRLSEKELQRLADKEEAEARKASKATKQAKKQRQLEEGDEPVPRQDTVFTSQEVEARHKKSKTLPQRDARVPTMKARPAAIAGESSRGRSMRPMEDLRCRAARAVKRLVPASIAVLMTMDTPEGLGTLDTISHQAWIAGATVLSSPRHSMKRSLVLGLSTAISSPPAHLDLHAGFSRIPPSDNGLRARRQRPEEHRPRDRSQSRHRSQSPATGDKRTHSPDDDIRAAQAQKINEHHGRARAKDYDDTTQELVSITNTWFRCLLATRDGFPDHTKEAELLKLAWSKACEELQVSMQITPDIAKLVTRRGSQMRGELKTKMRSLTELVFGFESGQNKKNVQKNRQLAEDLKDGLGFCYKEFPAVAAKRKGLYKAPIIQKSANLMWFNNRRDEGATHPELFGPALPKPAFALILSAIECSIDEWATGIKTDVPFTAADYRSVYQEHLTCLADFEKASGRRDILGNILTRVHNIGRFHSGAQPLAPTAHSSLSTAALNAAIQEYDDDEETVSDGENGPYN
ncbi:hypothetical protein C8R44DRAFT_890125 [Mycena epipterygia]|nr:hypothetical protein C8R44DRAFT_890125 [Mycena epipterygia]